MEIMEPIASKAQGVKVQDSATGPQTIMAPKGLTQRVIAEAGHLRTSDAAGLVQLAFHFGCIAALGLLVQWSVAGGRWASFLFAEVAYGIVQSFLFNAFHEMVHNTAFATPALNTGCAYMLGFLNFRGAKWFWCFHWQHHRFTNDPAKDPELSGGSLDLDDPTRSLWAYAAYLSGYPFGFERIVRMARSACGCTPDPWVADKNPTTRRVVRLESALFCAGYLTLALFGLFRPVRVGSKLFLYWLLPHCIGSGHLRLYQFAEHRACQMGPYTDTNAWTCSRTTATWWLYRKLAWQMPYHVEHHAFPNAPFHRLADVHALVRSAYSAESRPIPSGCNPDGTNGYLALHLKTLKIALQKAGFLLTPASAKAA